MFFSFSVIDRLGRVIFCWGLFRDCRISGSIFEFYFLDASSIFYVSYDY